MRNAAGDRARPIGAARGMAWPAPDRSTRHPGPDPRDGGARSPLHRPILAIRKPSAAGSSPSDSLRASATTIVLIAAYDRRRSTACRVCRWRRRWRSGCSRRPPLLPTRSVRSSDIRTRGFGPSRALAITVPLFLLLFVADRFLMAQADAGNFERASLTRTGSLGFTITVFATVGFGDISATSQAGRVAVMVQMILDLVVLGLLVRVFLNPRSSAENNRRRRADRAFLAPRAAVGPAGRLALDGPVLNGPRVRAGCGHRHDREQESSLGSGSRRGHPARARSPPPGAHDDLPGAPRSAARRLGAPGGEAVRCSAGG